MVFHTSQPPPLSSNHRREWLHLMTIINNVSGQLATVAYLRWRMFANSLRTARGKLELASRVLVTAAFTLGGLGGAFGIGAAAYFFVSQNRPQMLALLLWPIFMFWQLFPFMATAFTNNPDSSHLLRFPLGYPSYFLIRVAYGL